MKRFTAVLALLVLGVFTQSTKAQTVVKSATFTFAGTIGTNTCSANTSWNGVPNAYPENMGGICLFQADPSTGGAGSYLGVPFQLGFLNNGYLAGCNPMTWGAKSFSIGDGTHAGDTYTQPANTACPYYTGEYGGASNNLAVGFSVVANFTVVSHRVCSRYRCTSYLSSSLTGGSGTVEETTIN